MMITGCTKLRNEIETQRTKLLLTKRNETKFYETQRNILKCETKRNETKYANMRNEAQRNEIY
jgi:hypothetical protein